jgi:hypothetical protein
MSAISGNSTPETPSMSSFPATSPQIFPAINDRTSGDK